MDPATIVKTILVSGVIGIVVSIGVRSRPEDTLTLIRNPALGARAMLAMFVLVPMFVLLITWAIDLERPVRTALLALSVSPMPPIISKKEEKVGGDGDYAIGLQVLGTAFSIVAVPIMLLIAGRVFGISGTFDPFIMSKLLIVTVAAPLAIGIAIGRFLPAYREAVAHWTGLIGTIAMLAGSVPLLFVTWRPMLALTGNGILLIIFAITAFALLAGHLLGGPDDGNRGALAVASAARHPGVAITLSTGLFPTYDQEITAAVLLFLVANIIFTIPYMAWRKRNAAHG